MLVPEEVTGHSNEPPFGKPEHENGSNKILISLGKDKESFLQTIFKFSRILICFKDESFGKVRNFPGCVEGFCWVSSRVKIVILIAFGNGSFVMSFSRGTIPPALGPRRCVWF